MVGAYLIEANRRPLVDTDGGKIAIPVATSKNIFAGPFAPKISRITIGFAVATPRTSNAVQKGSF